MKSLVKARELAREKSKTANDFVCLFTYDPGDDGSRIYGVEELQDICPGESEAFSYKYLETYQDGYLCEDGLTFCPDDSYGASW